MEEVSGPVFAKRRFKRINRKTKLHLVFNEDDRREFLTGFHKRKEQRKKKAKEELKKALKEEKKRIKDEAKEEYKKLVKSYEPIPELEEQLAKHYDVDNTTVSILELDTDLLTDNNFIIGTNKVKYEDQSEEGSNVKGEPEEEGKTRKEIKNQVKSKATKLVKSSSVFQRLNKINQIKQRKQSRHKQNQKQKMIEKKSKKKHKKPHPKK